MKNQIHIHTEFKQNSEEWHYLRLGKITGSSFHKLAGTKATKERYLYEKASELITKETSDSNEYVNIHMERGKEWENSARDAYILNKFPDDIKVEEVALIQLGDYIACSPDGLVNDDGMIEIKVPDTHNFLKIVLDIEQQGKNAIPREHYYQMQFNLYVSGRSWCDYVLYNPKFTLQRDLYYYRVERDEGCISFIKDTITHAIVKINEYVEKYNNIII